MRDLRDSPDRTIAFVSLKILLFAKSINATIHDVKTAIFWQIFETKRQLRPR